MSGAPFHLFEAYGVELEYMIVDRDSLAVLPVADRALEALAGAPAAEVEERGLGYSNELVLHLLEIKTAEPVPALTPEVAADLQQGVRRLGEVLGKGARLLPTGMHPWFDPETETRLWPGEGSEVYRAYDRIFGCRGHGWSNLQAVHLNLPFAGDEELGRLHAAVRLVLPILPALAASSPVMEGRVTGLLDSRLEAYRTNSRRFASITGEVIPEPVFTRADYEERILQPIYRDLAPLDPEGVLRHEFSNARGAIARFGRGSIEIRVLDVQEAPRADVAILALVAGVLKLLAEERWSSQEAQRRVETGPLARLLRRAITAAEAAEIDDPAYLALFGFEAPRKRPRAPRRRGLLRRGPRPGPEPATAGDLWRHLAREAFAAGATDEAAFGADLRVILEEGPLARRILRALGADAEVDGGLEIPRNHLREVYGRLADCLAAGELFRA
ncbi:MAG TPA: glutamate-cysteine ligase family protein [Thermoanaerobaculia bacterium]